MRLETHDQRSGLTVDLDVLRGCGAVLFDLCTAIDDEGARVHADAVTAARAVRPWRTGHELEVLADLWRLEHVGIAHDAGRLGNSIMAAASHYLAAEQHAISSMPSDHNYWHGR